MEIFEREYQTFDSKVIVCHSVESHVDSVKAIRQQLPDLREALLEVAEKDNDAKIQSEAKSLANNELGGFEFLVSIVIWYQILYMVNLAKNYNQKICFSMLLLTKWTC